MGAILPGRQRRRALRPGAEGRNLKAQALAERRPTELPKLPPKNRRHVKPLSFRQCFG